MHLADHNLMLQILGEISWDLMQNEFINFLTRLDWKISLNSTTRSSRVVYNSNVWGCGCDWHVSLTQADGLSGRQ